VTLAFFHRASVASCKSILCSHPDGDQPLRSRPARIDSLTFPQGNPPPVHRRGDCLRDVCSEKLAAMDLESAQRSTTGVGIITLFIGIVLVTAPSRVARLLRTGDHPAALRAIGASDLALVPGLLAGRRRWQWMTARAGLNMVIAVYCLVIVRRERAVGAKIGAIAMVGATVADSRTIVALRRAS